MYNMLKAVTLDGRVKKKKRKINERTKRFKVLEYNPVGTNSR